MAGAGYKLFATGDVLSASDVNLYLQQQTVMVFASAAARTTALASVLAEGMVTYLKDTDVVEIYTGAAWVSLDDPNAIQNSIVDAKGDLISATADNTPARLAVGNNGESLVADSSATTGLRYQSNFAAGKNKIINGDFNVWQRGTSVSATNTYAYISDRWQSLCDGAITGARTAFSPGTAPVAGYEGKYYLRYTKTSGTYWQVQQYIEDVQTLAGQTATISFWAKVDAAKTIYVQLSQNFGSGGSTTVTTSAGTQALTTSWVRYSFTVAVPSISGKTIGTSSNLALEIGVSATTGNVVFDLWGVQVEAANTATAFQTATGTLQGELAACQRYYQIITAGTTTGINSTTQVAFNPTFAPMRSSSITFALTGALGITDVYTADFTQSSSNITTNSNNGVSGAILSFGNFTGLTAYRGYSLKSTNQITASAEL